MAKRSYIQSIETKQSSPYKRVIRVPEAIMGIEGTSKREASRRRQSPLRSWSIGNRYVDESMLDAQAEKKMNPHGWSKKKNPICPSCFIQQPINGACGCGQLGELSARDLTALNRNKQQRS